METATNPDTSLSDGIKEQASQAAGQAKDTLKDAAGQAKDQASEAGSQAKGRVRDQLDSRITQVADRASSTAGDLRSVSEELRSRGNDQPARLAEQLAERAEQAAEYLHDNGADRVLQDLEAFGRRRPWVVIASGLAVGFVGSRLLKASSSDRYHGPTSRPASPSPAPPTTPSSAGPTETSPHWTAPSAPATTGHVPPPSPLETLATDATTKNRDRENGLSGDGRIG
jgi:uncharacterized protein YjbJ (UPF0337 family)